LVSRPLARRLRGGVPALLAFLAAVAAIRVVCPRGRSTGPEREPGAERLAPWARRG